MTEKIKEYRIRLNAEVGAGGRVGGIDPHYRYFNAFTPDEAIESELSVRSKEGNASSVIHIEEYNPYADQWKMVLNSNDRR